MQKISLFLLMISMCVNLFQGSTIESKHMNSADDNPIIIIDVNSNDSDENVDSTTIPTFENLDKYESTFDKIVDELIATDNKSSASENLSLPSVGETNNDSDSVAEPNKSETSNDCDRKDNESNNENSDPTTEPSKPSTTDPSNSSEQSPTEPPATEPKNDSATDESSKDNTSPTDPSQKETEPPAAESEQPTSPSPSTPTTQPKKCTTHDYVFKSTQVVNEYELCDYVKDIYECSSCGSLNAEMHLTSANLSSGELRSIANSMVSYVNSLRRDNGLCELWTSSDWNSWADTRSRELSISYGHSRPNGGSWMNAIGNGFTVGENIAFGQYSGYDFYSAFCNSGSHRATMLEPSAVGIAISIHVDDNGNAYCAMILISQY